MFESPLPHQHLPRYCTAIFEEIDAGTSCTTASGRSPREITVRRGQGQKDRALDGSAEHYRAYLDRCTAPEVWQQLRYFTRAANVKQLLGGQTSSQRAEAWPADRASAAATEIASCLEQADEYIQASRAVGLATKPLLQFYSIEALAKAMILAAAPTITLRDPQYHGLSTRPSAAAGSDREGLQRYFDSPAAGGG
jgi:hypothetical protein